MKKYERYIVYPLLFIALFCSVGDEFVSSASNVIDQIVAKSITIVNNRGDKVVEISGSETYGEIYIKAPKTERGIAIVSNDESNFMTFYKPKGDMYEEKIKIMASENESTIDVYSPKEKSFAFQNGKLGFTLPSIKITSKAESNMISMLNPTKKETIAMMLLANTEYNLISLKDPDYKTGTVLYADPTNHSINVVGPGAINYLNSHEDVLVSLGQTTQGHGSVFTYDKYGDQYRSYGFFQ